jgi:hypothetical protein
MNDARKKDLFAVADRLHAAGHRVSLRAVIPKLAKGGSNREVGPVLRDWKAQRGYQPALKVKALPVPLQELLAKAAGELWAAAQVEAAAALEVDRANMAARAQADEETLLDALDEAEAEARRLRESLARVEARLDRIRAEDFWDRVMREIFVVLPAPGATGREEGVPASDAMTPEEILPHIRPWTLRAAALHREPIDAPTLRKKMDMRVSHKKLFEKAGKAYRRRPEG